MARHIISSTKSCLKTFNYLFYVRCWKCCYPKWSLIIWHKSAWLIYHEQNLLINMVGERRLLWKLCRLKYKMKESHFCKKLYSYVCFVYLNVTMSFQCHKFGISDNSFIFYKIHLRQENICVCFWNSLEKPFFVSEKWKIFSHQLYFWHWRAQKVHIFCWKEADIRY